MPAWLRSFCIFAHVLKHLRDRSMLCFPRFYPFNASHSKQSVSDAMPAEGIWHAGTYGIALHWVIRAQWAQTAGTSNLYNPKLRRSVLPGCDSNSDNASNVTLGLPNKVPSFHSLSSVCNRGGREVVDSSTSSSLTPPSGLGVITSGIFVPPVH